jgi:hypothetical protein
MRFKNLLLLSTAVLLFSLAFSQRKNGIIAGYVKDASSRTPLFEAVITVSSPALDGKKFAVTDSTGLYKIPDLPPGLYTVSFEMEGFKTFSRENIQLAEGMSLGVSFEMAKDRSVQDTIPKKRKRVEITAVN